MSVDSLLGMGLATWQQTHSQHFVLYTERDVSLPTSTKALLDSLEAAWRHDTELLGVQGNDQRPVNVVVTHSWAVFPRLLAPSTRGHMWQESKGGELILLVHNDSIRAFTRHEVMHAVSQRYWGPPGAAWVDEGLATFADGRCQGTSVLAVARDLLAAEPAFAATDLDARYKQSAGPVLGRRLRAYALVASMVSFVYANGGAEAVRELRRDGIAAASRRLNGDSLTVAWRRYVAQASAAEPGLSSEALDKHGCG